MISWNLLQPELWVCALVGLLFAGDLCTGKKEILKSAAIAGSLVILGISFFVRDTGTTFSGAFISDGLSIFFKIFFLLNAFLVIVLSRNFLKNQPRYTGEYLVLVLSATLGMMLMVSSLDLLTFYISLELLSISSYVLSGYQKSEPRSIEAGIKYLLLGAMASGILLFGISLIFGATGTIQFNEIAAALSTQTPGPLLSVGLVLVLVALSFKIAVVPFHMWVPDVYEGAPTPVVAFFSVGTKAAGFAVLIRLFLTCFGSLKFEWGMLMAIMSGVTIIMGNLLAIPQTNIKRFMGYSSIAQAGYILMGLAMASLYGLSASLFYLVAYLFSNLCAFAVIIIHGERAGSDEIDDYRGLARRSPPLALAMLIALMSLGGVPPLVGFLGKLYLFSAAIDKGFVWLVVIGVLMSVVSIYYYLMVLKRVYIEASPDVARIRMTFWEKTALAICGAGTVIFGFFPSPVFDRILSLSHSFLFALKILY